MAVFPPGIASLEWFSAGMRQLGDGESWGFVGFSQIFSSKGFVLPEIWTPLDFNGKMGILWIYSFIRRFSWDEEVGRCWDTTRKSIPVSQIPKDFQGKPEIGAFQAVNTRVESVHSLHGNPGISHPLIVQKFPKNAPNPWNILLGALPHLPMRNNPFGNIHSGCNTWIWGGSIPKKTGNQGWGWCRAHFPNLGAADFPFFF